MKRGFVSGGDMSEHNEPYLVDLLERVMCCMKDCTTLGSLVSM